MKLYYYKDDNGNFGDDLNPWLWSKLKPNIFDENHDEIFVGIGTLINHRIPESPVKHVFGSGVGYGNLPRINEKWIFHAVRGKLSASALGLPPEKSVTDAAVLMRLVAPPMPEKRFQCGLVVTGHSLTQYDWSKVCEQSGVRFISCHWDVDRVLHAMGECELLLCEAMHGAIVADTLRIPWIPVSLYGELLDFKWKDWLSSIDLEYKPVQLTSLFSSKPEQPLPDRVRNQAKRILHRVGLYSQPAPPPRKNPSNQKEVDVAIQQLSQLSLREGTLSRDGLIDRHIEQLSELLNYFD